MKLADKNYAFRPPASLKEVEGFEKKYGIELPDEYRSFLLNVADGGIMLDNFPLLSLRDLEVNKGIVQREFPFSDYWIWEDEDDIDEAKIKEIEYGNLALIDIGCAQTWNLILHGKCAGEMWCFTDVGIQPACPRRGFLSWFEYWLDGGDDYFSDFTYGSVLLIDSG